MAKLVGRGPLFDTFRDIHVGRICTHTANGRRGIVMFPAYEVYSGHNMYGVQFLDPGSDQELEEVPAGELFISDVYAEDSSLVPNLVLELQRNNWFYPSSAHPSRVPQTSQPHAALAAGAAAAPMHLRSAPALAAFGERDSAQSARQSAYARGAEVEWAAPARDPRGAGAPRPRGRPPKKAQGAVQPPPGVAAAAAAACPPGPGGRWRSASTPGADTVQPVAPAQQGGHSRGVKRLAGWDAGSDWVQGWTGILYPKDLAFKPGDIPASQVIVEEGEFEVEQIMDEIMLDGKKWLLPKWKGYELRPGSSAAGLTSGDPTQKGDWEPEFCIPKRLAKTWKKRAAWWVLQKEQQQ